MGNQESREKRILFVRTRSIPESMVKIPRLVVNTIIVMVAMMMMVSLPSLVPSSFGSPKALDLIIYPDGSTHVSTEIDADLLDADYHLALFGSDVDNFVAVGQDGFLLTSIITDDSALIETFGSSIINVEYDIHDLVSKQGRVWTFSLNAPVDFTLLLPKNSAIVGMTSIPIYVEKLDDQNRLTLSKGPIEINYLFSTIPTPLNQDDPDSTMITTSTTNPDYVLYTLIVGVIVAIIAGAVIVVRARQKVSSEILEQQKISPPVKQENRMQDSDTIFKLKPDIRQDDKEIVKFIFSKGGEVLESELRKRFLQPRTTMWRAVKRLERMGIIEIQKKDMQNLVKLKTDITQEESK